MDPIVLLVTLCLCFCQAEVVPLFQQTGKDLLLELKEAVTLEETDILIWNFNGSKDIARSDSKDEITFFKQYLGRAELFPQNLSLLLRHLTKSDSGDYKAHVSGDDAKVIAEYRLTVLDPVSPVKLTVKSCSSDFSNLTVSCSTQDSLISRAFTCDDQICSEEKRDRAEFNTPAASLKVYLKNDSIICVHSNQVSRTEDVSKIEELKDFCKRLPGPKPRSTLVTKIVVPIFLFIVILLVAVFLYHRKKHKCKRESVENTVYEIPQIVSKGELPKKRPTNDASPTSPPTIYSTVGNSGVTKATPEAGRETLPESLYSSVQKAEKS